MPERVKLHKENVEPVEGQPIGKNEDVIVDSVEVESLREAKVLKEKIHKLHIEAEMIKLNIANLTSGYEGKGDSEGGNDQDPEMPQQKAEDLLKKVDGLFDTKGKKPNTDLSPEDFIKQATSILPQLDVAYSYYLFKKEQLDKREQVLVLEIKEAEKHIVNRASFKDKALNFLSDKKAKNKLDQLRKEKNDVGLDSFHTYNHRNAVYAKRRSLIENTSEVLSGQVATSIQKLAVEYFDLFNSSPEITALQKTAIIEYVRSQLQEDDPHDVMDEVTNSASDLIESRRSSREDFVSHKLYKTGDRKDLSGPLYYALMRIESSGADKYVIQRIVGFDFGKKVEEICEPLRWARVSSREIINQCRDIKQLDQKVRDFLFSISGDLSHHDILRIWETARDNKAFQVAFGKSIQEINTVTQTCQINDKFSPDHLPRDLYHKLVLNLPLHQFNAELVKAVNEGRVTAEAVMNMPDEIPDLLDNSEGLLAQMMKAPEIFLASKEAASYSRDLKSKYGKNTGALRVAMSYLKPNNTLESKDAILKLPKKYPGLINTEEKESSKLLSLVFENHEIFFPPSEPIALANRIGGTYGIQAERILNGYIECAKAGVVSGEQTAIVIEFLENFRVISPAILKGYIEAKKLNQEELYIAELKSAAEKMVSSEIISEEQRSKEYYDDLIKHVYPKNSANFGGYEQSKLCSDRSADLEKYKVKKRYEIDLFASGRIDMKEGETLNEEKVGKVKNDILAIQRIFESVEYDPAKMIELVEARINELYVGENAELGREEKLFIILAETLYGNSSLDRDMVKQLVVTYEFALNEDVRDYIKGTSDRVASASNKDYALLCELNEFYNDRIKEVYRRITEKAYVSEHIQQAMPRYFEMLVQQKEQGRSKESIDKLQLDKLGMSPGFISQIKKALKKRNGKEYTDEQVKKIISAYERVAGGLTGKKSESRKSGTQAIYGQLKSQRDKTRNAVKELTGEEINPEELFLSNVNFEQLLQSERSISSGVYNQDQFAAYTVENLIGLFDDEQTIISGELDKFQSESGNSRKVLNAFITKNKESANARMTGGVCVAADNPSKDRKVDNIWDMENYFQMVFQDPESLMCTGLVLLHAEEHNGENILCASLNPSSTYLYTVDERALFEGIMKSLETFANENNFSKIAVAHNKAIRTNRTGGEFEKALDARIAAQNVSINFDPPKTFSFNPAYVMTGVNVVWQNN
ncbi:MAG: hypothetical protein V4664_02370 [Patescibacteria group bacterium]